MKLPRSLLELYQESGEAPNDEESNDTIADEVDLIGEGGGIQLDMNWNICKYLPEAGSCQDWFRVSC